MINELDVPGTDLWKYVDDTTISETISKNQASHIQAAVDIPASRATVDKFQLNETKCKELLIKNTKNPTSFDPVVVNGMPIDLVTSAKILGLNISNDLRWNCHIDFIIKGELRGKNDCISGIGPFHSVSIFDMRFCWRRISSSKNYQNERPKCK